MRTTERHARNDRIVQLRARGLTMKQIAAEVGVSERHCARILDERKQTTLSSTSRSEGEGPSDASATKLLDRLQTTVGDIAAIARAKAGPYGTATILRVGIMLGFAERDIEELRRRSELLTPMDDTTITGGGPPPSEVDMS
ncbi:MAG: helix-turn-helix domain-containing protein [Actinomycetota bacterium]|jgi:AraC-like DNA-binding protein|nr:helix-turn-helix domain-containing protein [Actinomycetota bacterium]